MSPRQQSMDTGEVYDTKKLIDDHDEVINSLPNTDGDNNTWVQGIARDVAKKSVNTTRFISILNLIIGICNANIWYKYIMGWI